MFLFAYFPITTERLIIGDGLWQRPVRFFVGLIWGSWEGPWMTKRSDNTVRFWCVCSEPEGKQMPCESGCKKWEWLGSKVGMHQFDPICGYFNGKMMINYWILWGIPIFWQIHTWGKVLVFDRWQSYQQVCSWKIPDISSLLRFWISFLAPTNSTRIFAGSVMWQNWKAGKSQTSRVEAVYVYHVFPIWADRSEGTMDQALCSKIERPIQFHFEVFQRSKQSGAKKCRRFLMIFGYFWCWQLQDVPKIHPPTETEPGASTLHQGCLRPQGTGGCRAYAKLRAFPIWRFIQMDQWLHTGYRDGRSDLRSRILFHLLRCSSIHTNQPQGVCEKVGFIILRWLVQAQIGDLEVGGGLRIGKYGGVWGLVSCNLYTYRCPEKRIT